MIASVLCSLLFASSGFQNESGTRLAVDGQPPAFDVEVNSRALPDYTAPILQAVRALYQYSSTEIGATQNLVRVNGSKYYELTYQGKRWVQIPVDTITDALVYDPPGSATPTKRFPLHDFAKKGDDGYILDVEELAPLFGCSVSFEGQGIDITTPNAWASELGFQSEIKEIQSQLPSLSLVPQVGVSPVVEDTVHFWIKTGRDCYGQIYSLNGLTVRPILGLDYLGQETQNFGDDGFQTKPRLFKKGQLYRYAIKFADLKLDGQGKTADLARYLFAFSEKAPSGDGDIVAAMRSRQQRGELGAHVLTGLRQILKPSGLVLRLAKPDGADQRGKEFAVKHINTPEMFTEMNGVPAGDKLNPNARYIYLEGAKNTDEYAKDLGYSLTSLYVTKKQDTPESLAKKWKVSKDDFIKVNSLGDPKDGDIQLEPGSVVWKMTPAKSDDPTPPAAPQNVGHANDPDNWVQLKRQVTLRSEPEEDSKKLASLAAGSSVKLRTDGGDWVQVAAKVGGDLIVGYVNSKYLTVPANTFSAKAPAPVDPRAQGPIAAALSFGSRYIGRTPYLMGGTSLEKGIDCSHFVWTILRKSGLPCPEPPVTDQQKKGRISHVNFRSQPDYFVMGDNFAPQNRIPKARYNALSDINNLRPGDRIIVQRPPNLYHGWPWHTGVYYGRYGSIRHAMLQSGGGGVGIRDLEKGNGYPFYQFAVRDNAR